MAKKQKFYAIKIGRHPGIYDNWDAAQKEVTGISGADYKSFFSRQEANNYLTEPKQQQTNSYKEKHNLPAIILFTDGGSRNHGNVQGGHIKANDKAAWAYLIDYNGKQHSDSAGEYGVTNNKMEITALVKGLQWLYENNFNSKSVGVISDSKYVLNAIQKGWMKGWKQRGWKRSAGPLKNQELWQDLDKLLLNFKHIKFAWTKGHATNKGNIFVDELLNKTMDNMK